MTTNITALAQREKFEAWVITQICISKSMLEGLRTSDGYRNSTLSGRDYNLMWNLWKAAGAELVEALEKAQQLIDELQQGFIANQEEAHEAIKYATELKEQLARANAGREEAFSEVDEMQKSLDHTHRRRTIWRWRAFTAEAEIAALRQRIAELESRTVKLPDGWQFEECEIEGCENGAIFSVGTGSRNIHLCDKCAHDPQNSRLKKSPLSKRLPFKMSAGIKVEAE